ncbi:MULTISPECIES: hypothetical protein [Crocosphaera]|uniref:Uncharacterized protein n=3 Tax=Crocosphaera watsonii TaxID=263511 RepID=T2IUP1_CROWT|nr:MULTISPECIES: hypothetical protein [Crocosphaera]MCH2245019.1 hypothetical protein [Crocosphaera sp.]NQZ62351.1 hypothetical protein [Crocosphaera sp.]CCQ51119.1 hypothetical protein CWATWH8502_3742 [Crocosphaera watsonii WH 8502]CCQ57336.1 hypothetical protein CWATWH0005_1316 [Crocosphaera watsonii WH 0005]CCQ59655.1 hypothetical protein CWATWH0401_60 [Crocosphaera watsonii WH 0401]
MRSAIAVFRDTFDLNHRHAYAMGKNYDRIAGICFPPKGARQLTILL